MNPHLRGSLPFLDVNQCGPAGFVVCENGMVGSMTCSAACGGLCCTGFNACHSFTGTICKDNSCSGKLSCVAASSNIVKDGCKGEL